MTATVIQINAARRHRVPVPMFQVAIYWWAGWLLACWPVFSTTKPTKSTGHRGNEGTVRGR